MLNHIDDRYPTWQRWQEIPRVCLDQRNLRSTLVAAAIVGTLLFVINQLDLVLSGHAGPRLWLKVALTYVVPFIVGNYGIVVGTRRTPPTHVDADGPRV